MSASPSTITTTPDTVASAPRQTSTLVWVGRRILLGLVVLLAISFIVFLATQALPSDPARAILGRDSSPEQVEALRERLGLDRSLPAQYVSWLGDVATGDLGQSLSANRPVWATMSSPAENSLTLVALVMLFTLPIALVIGLFSALRRDGVFDKSVLTLSLGLTALPEFVLGLGLVFLLATGVAQLFPAVAIIPPGDSAISHPKELVLPVLTLILAIVVYLYRLVRAAAIEVLDSDYVTMARLKGMPESRVLRKHVLPNALIPVVQGVAIALVWLLGGVVVVEFIFRYPGLGSLLTDAVSNRDVPLIQGIVLLFAAAAVVFNLIADVLTVYLSPRLRTAGGSS